MFYVFPRAVALDTCEKIVKECKQKTLEEAGVYNYPNDTPEAAQSKRTNEIWVDDPVIRQTKVTYIKGKDSWIIDLARSFLTKANEIQFHYDLKYIQAVQFAEYSKGGHYTWHQDDSGIDDSNEVRKLSFGLALSNPDDYEGGELQFYNGDKPISDLYKISGEQIIRDIKSQGSVVIFDARDFHRVTPVTSGVRHSLVSWATGPNFK